MKKNLLRLFSIISLSTFFPIITFAQGIPENVIINNSANSTSVASTCDALAGLGKILCQIHQILNSIIPILVALGVVYFVWGVVRYVIADGEEAKKKGKDGMIYGIIGFAVIIGLWGLVNIIVLTFGLNGASMPSLESLTGASSTCSLAGSPKFQDLLCYITKIINDSIIPLIFALATVMFVWGVVNFFIINANEEAKRAQGKQFMIWGIVALAVMLSVWGLAQILGNTFGIDGTVLPKVIPPH
jgi:hypothetical protein